MGHGHVLNIGHVLWGLHCTASVRNLELQTQNIALLELLLGSIQSVSLDELGEFLWKVNRYMKGLSLFLTVEASGLNKTSGIC